MGEISDLVFTIMGKLGRWLNIKGQRMCFIVWAFCLLYWTIRNIQLNLMVQTLGCLFSLGMHIYGWFNWKNKKIGE